MPGPEDLSQHHYMLREVLASGPGAAQGYREGLIEAIKLLNDWPKIDGMPREVDPAMFDWLRKVRKFDKRRVELMKELEVSKKKLESVVTKLEFCCPYHKTGGPPGAECSPMTAQARPGDAVNHPTHYNLHPSGVECIEITRHFNFNVGNAIKYCWRAGLKGDRDIEDLRKALFYIKDEIARLEQQREAQSSGDVQGSETDAGTGRSDDADGGGSHQGLPD